MCREGRANYKRGGLSATKLEIKQINSKYELQIDRITEMYWTKERREDIKAWWKCLYSKA